MDIAVEAANTVKVEFYVDGVLKSTDTSEPFGYPLDTSQYLNGQHTIEIKAYNAKGQETTTSYTITVENDTPPEISIISLAGNPTLSGVMDITADASDDKGIAKVEFSIDGILAATDANAPYAYTWNTASSADGAHAVEAKAYDTVNQTTSVQYSVTVNNISPPVDTDNLPTVSITAPIDGHTVSGIINVTVDARDDKGISKVEFYIDSALKSTDAETPYSYSWDTVQYSSGTHTVKVTAYDTANQTASKQHSVTVNNVINDNPPSVTLTAPTDESTVSGTISVTATASDDKGISKVEFYIDNSLKATDTTSPYSYSWNTVQFSTGTYAVKATAYDTANQTASKQHSVTVNNVANDNPPTVTLTAPTDGSTVSGTVSVTATASDDKGVSKVEFYIDSTLKSTDTTSPYSCSWDTVQYSSGTHIIKAKVYDTANQTATDQHAVTINNPANDNPPTLNITSPTDGSIVLGTVNITATASDDKGVSKVEFYIDGALKATDINSPYSYSWDTTQYNAGTHTVKVIAYDTANQTANKQISITVNNDNAMYLYFDDIKIEGTGGTPITIYDDNFSSAIFTGASDNNITYMGTAPDSISMDFHAIDDKHSGSGSWRITMIDIDTPTWWSGLYVLSSGYWRLHWTGAQTAANLTGPTGTVRLTCWVKISGPTDTKIKIGIGDDSGATVDDSITGGKKISPKFIVDNTWKQLELDLTGENLSSINGPFFWVIDGADVE